MDSTTKRPVWSPITKDSTREEVLAAVEEHERASRETSRDIAKYSDPAMFPGMPTDPSRRRGCYSSADGNVIACYGDGSPTAHEKREAEEAEHEARIVAIQLERQALVGEEDQSAPGWDDAI